jgi:predicted metal-dependent hydrolase
MCKATDQDSLAMNAQTRIDSVTPADLHITPRDRRFGRESATPRWWHGGKPAATALYNALSATFPLGEAFFVESVRAFREGAPEPLAEEIRAFTKQEVIHSREHLAFNRRAADAGYDLTGLETKVRERLALTKSKPPVVSLAATMALEHFTAILAHELLADPRHLEGAEAETAALWRWHAAEEIEHKGVAYDTWMHATKAWPRRKRWEVKAKVMLLVTRNFVVDRTAGALELMRQDGITGPRAWASLLWYSWVRPGMLRKIAGAWAKFFLPGFHPWNEDDRALIAGFENPPVLGEDRARTVRGAA